MKVGTTSINDTQFKTKFEDPYYNIHKKFYLCLGNHDYGNSLFLSNNYKSQDRILKNFTLNGIY